MRLEFSDAQKAEIFVRDRGVCAFSGKSLWMLDYGVSPTYGIDWVDHIIPAARGGDNSTENGVCASHFYNSKKRDNSNDNKFMFRNGRPTSYFFYFYETLPLNIADHLSRFSQAQPSDWYFNRALFRFMLGVASIRARETGKVNKRDENYYAKSTLKILNKWKYLAMGSKSIHLRGLAPENCTDDQLALLKIAQFNDQEQLAEHMRACYPWFSTSCTAINLLAHANSPQEINSIAAQIDLEKLPARVASMMQKNLELLPAAYTNSEVVA
ncbi:HNH endonuclease [Pseudomonas paeninsulae]|uniref:HNH endonuclease n=1 Tax=Pseudomonas paeninsulae TaxID=3110772 RepID=UPI002D768ED6|nr:HNH endonuclease domain-containing protein [Pseudomonas sp. IT1137]